MNQENTTVKSLVEMANEEAIARRGIIRPTTSNEMKRILALPPEEQKREEQILTNRMRLRSAIQDFFRDSVNRTALPTLVLCVPGIIAHNRLLGSNAAMRLVLAERHENAQHVAEFLTELQNLINYQLPNRINLAHLLSHNYGETNRTLAECYWLFELCSFLGIGSAFFGNLLSEVMFGKNVNLDELDFTKVLTPGKGAEQSKEQMLFELASKQYMDLENLLRRM